MGSTARLKFAPYSRTKRARTTCAQVAIRRFHPAWDTWLQFRAMRPICAATGTAHAGRVANQQQNALLKSVSDQIKASAKDAGHVKTQTHAG